LLNAGDHVPVTLFVEVVGKVNDVPEQIEVGKVKEGLNLVLEIIIFEGFLAPTTEGVVAPETTYTTRTLYWVLPTIALGMLAVIVPLNDELIGF
jgi:hypothetical protein